MQQYQCSGSMFSFERMAGVLFMLMLASAGAILVVYPFFLFG